MLHLLSGLAAVASLHGSVQAVMLANPFSQLIGALTSLVSVTIDWLYRITHNYGWSMLLLALAVSLLVLPLSLQSLKSMQEVQALAPYIKRLQTKYKNDRQKLGEEQMKLYREHGVNPLGGCLPMLAQYPFLFAVYGAIKVHNTAFQSAGWLWISTPLAHKFPTVLATNLAESDLVLLLAYAISMYFSIKLTPTMSTDAQSQQMIRMQSFMMPVMLLFLGHLYHWSAAFVLYWFGFNVISMAERWYVMRRPSRIPKLPEETPATLAGYPHDCPECHHTLTVVKGSKCENCGAKVRRLPASDTAAQTGVAGASPNGARGAGGKMAAKGAKKTT
ncbi:MAG TPA: YidC/Oxa1 family membrane protein insertase [Candidatus Eremiobacteraceae bacterium]|nr:YidC/Oxa1 family membrane protein insertase [Candidatus Eremiobacteraceae bacterium]